VPIFGWVDLHVQQYSRFLLPVQQKKSSSQMGLALPVTSATIQSKEQQADVAQLVEQLIRNQQVVSSSLTVGSIDPPHPKTQAERKHRP